MIARISNLDLLDFFLELAEEQEKFKEDDNVEIDAEINSHICPRMEVSYMHVIQRVKEIGYRLDWANHIKRNKTDRPSTEFGQSDRILHYAFSDIEKIPGDQLLHLNNELYESLLISSFRGLCELFVVYLDHFYELVFLMQMRENNMKPEQIREAAKFRELSLGEKFGTLETKYKISPKYKNDILSMYSARNIYAHSDPYFSPIPRKKRNTEITWLGHTLRFKRRNSSKWVDEEKMPKPYSGNDFSQVQTKFFDKKRRQKRYLDQNGRPNINEWDVREMCHFYIHIFEVYHQELIRFAKRLKFQPRNFKEYRFKLEMVLIGEERP